MSRPTIGDPRLPESWWKKIRVGDGGCWLWQAAVDRDGYGHYSPTQGHHTKAHRHSYSTLVGPIPSGLQIDHLCRVKPCVNPGHLEVVTGAENNRRSQSPSALNMTKQECLRGHPLSGENLWEYRGWRHCRTCRREQSRAYRERKRLAERAS